jgi:hypothetical protein
MPALISNSSTAVNMKNKVPISFFYRRLDNTLAPNFRYSEIFADGFLMACDNG